MNANIQFIQLIPPLFVLCILVIAFVSFHKNFVQKSKVLCESIEKICQTIRSMTEGDDFMRKDGVARVFQDTPLETIWRDFAKTLHPQKGIINGVQRNHKYRLTAPVTMFFSVSSVIDRPLGVDYYKHLPGMLTGVGIIGTFTGLLFGLSNFDASTATTMNQSISLLISGVRDAFYASAAAITAAMVITHWEKSLYRRSLATLENLVDVLNSLFEPGAGEEYLATLVSHSTMNSTHTRDIRDDFLQAMLPVIRQLESIGNQQSTAIAESLEKALYESNKRLASQLEQSMAKHLREPIQGLGDRIENRLSHLRGNQQDLAMKVIRARQSENHNDHAIQGNAAS